MSNKKALKVIRLEVKNYMGIKVVSITPGPGVVRIEGRNRAGKSSVIGAIWAAIGGKNENPPAPIRKGQIDARIEVNLGELTVTRRFTEAGSHLEVKSNGLKYPSPQTMLDTLFTKVSMDPQAFIDLRPAQRREMLLDLTGARDELEVLESQQTDAYNERTLVNREIKNLQGKLTGTPSDEKIEEVSVQEIMQKIQEAERHNRLIDSIKRDIDIAKKQSADLEEQSKVLARRIGDIEEKNSKVITYCKTMEKELSGMTPIDTSEFEAEIASAEEHNAHVRAVRAANELRAELAEKQSLSEHHTAEIDTAQSARRDILNKTDLPVKGLSVEGDTITIDGKPFDNLSTSEQIRVAMELGIALNPTLRVMRISRGRELDTESMAAVEKFAAKKDCQIWIEYVTEESQGGFFIEDGEVKSIGGKK